VTRILHILTAPRAEGTPRLVLDCLSVPGYVHGVLCLNREPATLASELSAGAAWYEAVEAVRPGIGKYVGVPRAVAGACLKFRPDLIIGWPTWLASLIAIGARSWPKVKLVQHCGNPAHQDFAAVFLGDIRFMPFYASGGRFAACSDYVRDSFRRRTPIYGDRFQTVYNSVRGEAIARRAGAARAAWRRDPEERVLLMVATLEGHKDHATLLRAGAILTAQGRKVRIRLAGDGSKRRELEALARDLGCPVEFLGSRKDVPELLGQADLFVFATTAQEGLGIVLLEAMAAGLPVLASDVPACRELLAAGRWGTLIRPHDSTALAAAIAGAWHLDSTRLRSAREYAEAFTPERMLHAYAELSEVSSSPATL